MLRVAFPMRVDVFDKPGGDLSQIQQYIRTGATAPPEAAFHGEIVHNIESDLRGFDVIHLTNIDRPVETSHFLRTAKANGTPTVFSSIHHSYREIARFERSGRGGVVGALLGKLNFQQLEQLRAIVRCRRYRTLLGPTASVLRQGIGQSQTSILEGVDRVLVLTEKERRDIQMDFPYAKAVNFVHLKNGFEPNPAFEPATGQPREVDVCVVARVEARKNQIMILEALESLGLSGIFVGHENPNHPGFCKRFREAIAGSRSTYAGGMTPAETGRIMRQSKVHVSASWFEVSSLVDIESYFAGCRVVSSICGGTNELLGDLAHYVDPGSPESLRNGIAQAMKQYAEQGVRVVPLGEGVIPSWGRVAEYLSKIYSDVLTSRV
jgi:glycosyltransferase involved in cell wall biosynthesis